MNVDMLAALLSSVPDRRITVTDLARYEARSLTVAEEHDLARRTSTYSLITRPLVIDGEVVDVDEPAADALPAVPDPARGQLDRGPHPDTP